MLCFRLKIKTLITMLYFNNTYLFLFRSDYSSIIPLILNLLSPGKGRIRNICTNTKKIRIQKQKQKQKRRETEIFVRRQKQSLSNDFVSVSVSVPERNLRRINLSHPGHQTGGFSVDVISTTAKY